MSDKDQTANSDEAEVQESSEASTKTSPESTEAAETTAKRSSHANFENGRLVVVDHPKGEDLIANISEAGDISQLRMKEYEDLILLQVESRLDEAFYRLWCSEANHYFRQLLRYKNRAKVVKDKAG